MLHVVSKNKMKSKLLFVLLLMSLLQFFGEAKQLTLELHSNAEENVNFQSLFEVAFQFLCLRNYLVKFLVDTI